MKNIFFCFLTLALITTSCKKDETPIFEAELQLDGDNFSAPELAAGTFDLGVRFLSSKTSEYIGKNLESVDFYIQTKPTGCQVLIYRGDGGSTTGDLLYSKDVINSVSSNSWNNHVLDTPIAITGDDIWIVLRVTHNNLIGSLGCDAGPAAPNGDWVLAPGSTTWETYRNVTGGAVSINWNLRGQVSE